LILSSSRKGGRLRRSNAALLSSSSIAALLAFLLITGAGGGNETAAPFSASSLPLPTPPPRSKPSEPRALINGQPSPEALAKRFLQYLAGKDAKAIQSLRLTKREFCEYVWPELPASRIPNLTCDWAWERATLKSDGGLGELLAPRAGKRYELVHVRFAGGVEERYTYRIHKDTRLTLKDEDGTQKEVKALGSMLELDGKYKVFGFVSD